MSNQTVKIQSTTKTRNFTADLVAVFKLYPLWEDQQICQSIPQPGVYSVSVYGEFPPGVTTLSENVAAQKVNIRFTNTGAIYSIKNGDSEAVQKALIKVFGAKAVDAFENNQIWFYDRLQTIPPTHKARIKLLEAAYLKRLQKKQNKE